MPFEKGHDLGKGRPKGSKNKVESTTKKFLQDLIEGNTEKIEAELDTLTGKAFLDAVFNFMEYVQPKLSRAEVETTIEVEDNYIDLTTLSRELKDKLIEDHDRKTKS